MTGEPEAAAWLAAAPKDPVTGKVGIALLIEESRRRGYCICPKPLRQMIDTRGMTCDWCDQPEALESWNFWYRPQETKEEK